MEKACLENNTNEVNRLINDGYNFWNWGLFGACRSGHLHLVNLMVEKGATNWDLGLYGACQGGHLPLVNLMIEKGATYWDSGLYYSCRHGHLDIVNLMIEKGAIDWKLLVSPSLDTQFKMFKNIDFLNKCQMINSSITLRNSLKLYTLIIFEKLLISKDLFLIIYKFMVIDGN